MTHEHVCFLYSFIVHLSKLIITRLLIHQACIFAHVEIVHVTVLCGDASSVRSIHANPCLEWNRMWEIKYTKKRLK